MGRKHYREMIDLIPELSGKKGMRVEVRKNSKGEYDIETAMRILKKRSNREGLPKEMRRREYYESPSQTKRREKAEAIRRHKKELRDNPTDWY